MHAHKITRVCSYILRMAEDYWPNEKNIDFEFVHEKSAWTKDEERTRNIFNNEMHMNRPFQKYWFIRVHSYMSVHSYLLLFYQYLLHLNYEHWR